MVRDCYLSKCSQGEKLPLTEVEPGRLSPTEVYPGREVAERADGRVVAFVGEQSEPVAAELLQLGEAGGGARESPLHLLHRAVHLETRLGRPPVHRLPGGGEITARLGHGPETYKGIYDE